MYDQTDTSGFYLFDGGLAHAPNFVHSPDFYIHRNAKDTYTYPLGGWYWFDSREDARAFFGLQPEPLPQPEDATNFNFYDPNGGV